MNIDDLPSAKELQVKVVVMSEDGKVEVRIPQDLTSKKLVNNLKITNIQAESFDIYSLTRTKN